MTDYRTAYPPSDAPRAAVQGTPVPALRFDLATDRGPVTVEIPADRLAGASVVSRITFTANDSTVFSVPLFSHGVPLHSVCTVDGIELIDNPEGWQT